MIPGDKAKQTILEQMIRVNQAGEYGAKRIYQGQIDVLKGSPCEEELKHMAEQEEAHLAYFSDAIKERGIRPTALMPIWHMAGYAMGAVCASLGEKAAMACTVAVEEVIDEHYQEQLEQLKDFNGEEELSNTIEQFRLEELEHRDIGLEHDATKAPGYPVLSLAVKNASKLAIFLSKRL